jgi:hypothetical protein
MTDEELEAKLDTIATSTYPQFSTVSPWQD